jgi:hypothetical protein
MIVIGKGFLKHFLHKKYKNTKMLYRNIAFMVLAALYLIIIIVISLGAGFKRPRIMKGCNLSATPLYILMYILGFLMLILAVVMSTGKCFFAIEKVGKNQG